MEGSILGPILLFPFDHIIRRFDVSCHCYADDTQLCLSFTHNDPGLLSKNVNLGIRFDPNLSFEADMKSLVQSYFFHLRNISKIRPILQQKDLKSVIHAFILSRLDDCNALFTCLSKSSVARLQLVQNSIARLLTKTKRQCHLLICHQF
ncbi:hypothetical protein LDENG_00250530 [Lucifuga dentata]|nr:hypothetical protein LDENG_00250530 [Lucifuga dentata]